MCLLGTDITDSSDKLIIAVKNISMTLKHLKRDIFKIFKNLSGYLNKKKFSVFITTCILHALLMSASKIIMSIYQVITNYSLYDVTRYDGVKKLFFSS